jgi:hypothetical protein
MLPEAVIVPALAENGIDTVPAGSEPLAWEVRRDPAAARLRGNELTAEIPVGGVTPVRLGATVVFSVDGVNVAINELPG